MDRRRLIMPIALCLLWSMACGLLIPQARAGIVLKTMVVNPSRIKTQAAMLRAYLPKEVKPEDVVELHDLKIDYDVEKGLYYVYKKVELKPGESVNRSIEIKDIWIISKAELNTLTGRAGELLDALKNTAYFDAAVILQKSIEKKSNEILNKQEQAITALPQTHIAVYRDNMERLDSVKAMLAKLEKMLIESKISSGTKEKVSVKATWWVILGVIIALGVISLVFFVIWQRQAGITASEQKPKESLQNKE